MIKKYIKKLIIILIIFTLKFLRIFKIHIRINELETRAFGHYSKSIEIFLLENLNNKKNFIDIWFRNKKIANNFLYYKWKNFLNIFPYNYILKFIFNILIEKKLYDFIIPCKHWRINKNWYKDINKTLQKNPPIIKFNKNEIDIAKNLLSKKNFYLDKKFFCFANRDFKYTLGSKTSIEYQQFRNFSVDDFNYSLKQFVNKNFCAVRMGKIQAEKIKLNNKFIFDLPFLDITNDLVEHYLFSKCQFFITGDSGINFYSSLYRKPILIINVMPTILRDWNDENCFLTIFKKLYSSKFNRILNFTESMEVVDDIDNIDKIFKKLEINVINNSPKEIYDLIFEFLLRNNNKWIIQDDENKINDIIQNFSEKNFSIKLNKINVGYNFAKKNLDLFK